MSPHIVGDHHGSSSFLAETIAAAQANNIEHEVLRTAEVERRFPQFRLAHDEVGYFEPGGGFLRPEACVETQLDLACTLGAEVHSGETVLKVQAMPTSVEVQTDRGTYSTAHAIVSAGPWIGKLLPHVISRHLLVYRQVMTWFALARNLGRYTPQNFPVFIWITGSQKRDMFYGFPAIDGTEAGMKTATERYDTAIEPDNVDRTVTDDETASLYHDYIASRLPEVSSQCLRATTCLYTVASGARFVIDQADDYGRILFASACSGHGFKHSPAVGEALVRKAIGLAPLVDLQMFSAAHLPRPVKP